VAWDRVGVVQRRLCEHDGGPVSASRTVGLVGSWLGLSVGGEASAAAAAVLEGGGFLDPGLASPVGGLAASRRAEPPGRPDGGVGEDTLDGGGGEAIADRAHEA
jgi:hypothetical protein